MRCIVITTPYFFEGESFITNRLFEAGMERLHLRKPECTRRELEALLDAVLPEFYPRIVLHDHFEVAMKRGLGGIHLNRRNPVSPLGFAGSVSRSCHSLEEVRAYKPASSYVFLSPIFRSISKEGYGSGFATGHLKDAASLGVIDEKVIALGGIDPSKLPLVEELSFGGFAVLGALWGSDPSLSNLNQLIEQLRQLNKYGNK